MDEDDYRRIGELLDTAKPSEQARAVALARIPAAMEERRRRRRLGRALRRGVGVTGLAAATLIVVCATGVAGTSEHPLCAAIRLAVEGLIGERGV